MEWISFFDRQPEDGQEIYYYGEYVGVWRGVYRYSPNDPVSPHVILCSETFGIVDRMDVPWWTPCVEGMQRPELPPFTYPKDYPNGK
jgi:hypothetical protein